jgi:hypothetical protein
MTYTARKIGNLLPSIFINPRGMLGQSLAREGESAAASSAHETKVFSYSLLVLTLI